MKKSQGRSSWDRVVLYCTNHAGLYFGNHITRTTCSTRLKKKKKKSQLWNSIRVWYNLHGTGNLTVVRVCNSRISPRRPYVPRYLIRNTFHLYKMSIYCYIIDITFKRKKKKSINFSLKIHNGYLKYIMLKNIPIKNIRC